MASSLDPDNFPEAGARMPRGRTLGPSDSSDSGSDMAGPGLLDDDDMLNLEPDDVLDDEESLSDEDQEGDGYDASESDAEDGLETEDDEPEEIAPHRRRAGAGRKGRGQPHRRVGL
jgi:hypothetical protein